MARGGGSGEGPLGQVEVARLEAQRRLGLGAAHALNNALTAALGEVGFLRDERKGDAVVVEACDAIARELERCVRATAVLMPRRGAGEDEGPTDLVRAVRDAAAAMRAALGRRVELELRAPDDLVLVAAPPRDLDLLVVLLVQASIERVGRSARIELAVEPAGAGGAGRLSLRARAAAAAELAHDGARSEGPWSLHQDAAAAALVSRSGGTIAREAPAPGCWRAVVELPGVR